MNIITKISDINDSISLKNRLLAVILVVIFNFAWFASQAVARSTYSGQRLAEASIMLVKEKFGEQLDVTVPLPPSDQYFDTKDVQAEIIMDSKTVARHVYLTALFYEDGQLQKKVGITAQVTDKILLPVASSHIKAGEKITPDKIDYRPVDRFSLSTSVIADEKGIIGKTLLSDIRSGDTFASESLSSGKKIKRGEEIELVVIKGTVQVRATATALEDGLPGQMIRLERKGSKQIITATVHDDGRAFLTN